MPPRMKSPLYGFDIGPHPMRSLPMSTPADTGVATAKELDVALVSPLALKVSVKEAMALSVRSVNVARPLARIVTLVNVPLSVPTPVAIAATILIPARRTGLLLPSWSSTTGWVVNGLPAIAPPGWVIIASLVGAFPTVNELEVADV